MTAPLLKLVAEAAPTHAAEQTGEVVPLHANRHTAFTRALHWGCASPVLLGLGLGLGNRCTGGLRHVHHNLPTLVQWAATLTHLALYGLLLAVPVLGWAASNAHNVHVNLLGIPLPQIAPADSDLADQLDLGHSVLAWSLLATAAAHIAAALFHHFVKHDSVLGSMLPLRRPR